VTYRLCLRPMVNSVPVLSVILMLITTLTRIFSGSWDTAFAAGSLFVTWASLLLAVAGRFHVRE
jgi:hypothetical protein